MLPKTEARKNTYAGIFLLVFAIFLVMTTAVSELFRNPENPGSGPISPRHLFDSKTLATIEAFALTNGLGVFKFRVMATVVNKKPSWIMEEPRSLPANEGVIQEITDTLGQIKIRGVYPNDAINFSNYALDNPSVTLDLQYSSGETDTVTFGLINPINETTYIHRAMTDTIYHVDAFSHAMNSLSVVDFVDARAISIRAQEIRSLEIYRGLMNIPSLHIRKEGNMWLDKRNRGLREESVVSFLQEITSIKGVLILDDLDNRIQTEVETLLSRPLYRMAIRREGGEEIHYRVSGIINRSIGPEIEPRKFVIVHASNREHPTVVHRDILNHLSAGPST